MMGREENRERKRAYEAKHTISSVKHGKSSVMACDCMAATGTGSLVFIDDVTAEGSSSMMYIARNVLLIFGQMLKPY